MSFKVRKIRPKPRRHVWRHTKAVLLTVIRGVWGAFTRLAGAVTGSTARQRSYAVGILMVILAVFVVFHVMTGAYRFLAGLSPKSLLFALGSDLEKDENGYTNILLLGSGDEAHDGFDLIDTIMVGSIDYMNNAVSLFSIPRDFYVNTQHDSRINEVYRNNRIKKGEEGALMTMKEVVEEVVNLKIPYYAKVDFNGFVEVVDGLGGVTVNVEKAIHDPYYPNATEDGYQTFSIEAGLQELDGETALKFVRSRKTTSDFDRAARQQQVLAAVQEKALSKNVLVNPKAIKKLYESAENNVVTNLSIREMIALGGYATQMDRSRLISKVIHDDPQREGGFLYTPERKYYNGAFVLIPEGVTYEVLHQYTNLVFRARELFLDPPRIEILNGTKKAGQAGALQEHLSRFGFKIVLIDNVESEGPVPKSTLTAYRWTSGAAGEAKYQDQKVLEALQAWVPGEILPGDEAGKGQGIDITITLGLDYLE